MAKKIRTISSIEGFRRGGVAHSRTPTDFPVSRFTKAQLEQIKNEPRLVVEEVEDDGKEPTAAELIAEIQQTEDRERLIDLAKDSRKSVHEAAVKRHDELFGEAE